MYFHNKTQKKHHKIAALHMEDVKPRVEKAAELWRGCWRGDCNTIFV